MIEEFALHDSTLFGERIVQLKSIIFFFFVDGHILLSIEPLLCYFGQVNLQPFEHIDKVLAALKQLFHFLVGVIVLQETEEDQCRHVRLLSFVGHSVAFDYLRKLHFFLF